MDGNGIKGEVPAPSEAGEPPLEFRVRRLEDAVAALQDTRLLEDRVAERVSLRLNRLPPPDAHERGPASLIVEAARRMLPVTVEAVHTDQHPDHTELPPPSPSPAKPAWLLLDAYREFQAMLRMYLDPLYPVTWRARVIPVTLLALIATSWIWLPFALLLPGSIAVVYVKVVDLILAFILYKFLSREARRFMDYEASRFRRY